MQAIEEELENITLLERNYYPDFYVLGALATEQQIKHMTGRGVTVINQYIKIIKEYHPEVFEDETFNVIL